MSMKIENLTSFNETHKRIIKFTEKYARTHFEIPSLERVEHEFNSQSGTAYKKAYYQLLDGGMLPLIIENINEDRRREEYEKTVRYTKDAVRSGVREMSKEELRIKAFVVGDMHFNSGGVRWDFFFTVDRNRGQADLMKTSKPWADSFSPYGNSLVEGMFKKWHTEAQ